MHSSGTPFPLQLLPRILSLHSSHRFHHNSAPKMNHFTPTDLLAYLQQIKSSPPAELTQDPDLRTQIRNAARDVYLALEQPHDVVARVMLSQVSSIWRISKPFFIP